METEKFLCDLIAFVATIKKMPPGNYKNELLNSAKTMAEKLLLNMFDNLEELTAYEIDLGVKQGKVAAIKEYRSRTCSSLLEAKNAVENYFSRNGLRFY